MESFKKFEDPYRYYNWYMGFTAIEYPDYLYNDFKYVFRTCATFGNMYFHSIFW